VVEKGFEDRVKAIFDRWDLHSDIIGQVTGDGLARVKEGDKVVAEVPVSELTEPPLYRLKGVKPEYLERLQNFDLSSLPDLPLPASQVLLRLLASPNIASKEWVYRQYDHQVLTNTVVGPGGGDAAVLRIKGTKKAIALTIDGNGRYCYLDPYVGGAMAVAEAARNLVCAGAQPLALTNCLNFGNPEKPEVYYQLEEGIKGMAQACAVLGVPVISGNVSLYNETRGEAIYPTPVVGMLGLLEDVERRCSMGFQQEGDLVYVLGGAPGPGLAGSEYLEVVHGRVAGRPAIDLELERQVQQCCLAAIGQGLLSSAHDCSEGGLAVALAESAMAGGLGFQGMSTTGSRRRADDFLFGEQPSRIVISVKPDRAPRLEKMAKRERVPLVRLGTVGSSRFVLPPHLDLPLEELRRAWQGGLEQALRG
ncbi:MAG: AIR synthase related protein, partial [Chloroflexota bacterium]|nr:AIR synthase related protein [Chloroflexota bacterium]